ncbi:hypothetical protein VP01_4074g1 [Puccinia sorghi]|uniref:Uncharacterized protein n=1 Tax=Puccinia sorghi TaxID=27349 RepID=A0A0L6USB5_9BASI|nr:hypothetical protein VP01_4074g1 [Puccinia sorghi]
MHEYIEFLSKIENHKLYHFLHIEFLSFCFHIKGMHDICTEKLPQSCVKLCQAVNSSQLKSLFSCPCSQNSPFYTIKGAFSLPFCITLSHHLTPWELGISFSSTYSQLCILSSIFSIILFLKKFKFTSSNSSFFTDPFHFTLAQQPMQKKLLNCLQLTCRNSKKAFDCKVTVKKTSKNEKRCILDGSLAGACCMKLEHPLSFCRGNLCLIHQLLGSFQLCLNSGYSHLFLPLLLQHLKFQHSLLPLLFSGRAKNCECSKTKRCNSLFERFLGISFWGNPRRKDALLHSLFMLIQSHLRISALETVSLSTRLKFNFFIRFSFFFSLLTIKKVLSSCVLILSFSSLKAECFSNSKNQQKPPNHNGTLYCISFNIEKPWLTTWPNPEFLLLMVLCQNSKYHKNE